MTAKCERVNTYQVLEHVMGIEGLHPHRLATIRAMRRKLVRHVSHTASLADGAVLDIGCGSGAGTRELAVMLGTGQRVIGVDIDRRAIERAERVHGSLPNLSFFHGDLKSLLADVPGLKISAAICISVTMFLPDVSGFYQQIYASLLDGGIFIDAPFLFRQRAEPVPEAFRRRTYAVCGCDMTMFQLHQLESLLVAAGFSIIECVEHDFDLMKPTILFDDYPARRLAGNFFRNVVSPPAALGEVTSRYLLFRTLGIFLFFLKHRRRYASGELAALKPALDHDSTRPESYRATGAPAPPAGIGDRALSE